MTIYTDFTESGDTIRSILRLRHSSQYMNRGPSYHDVTKWVTSPDEGKFKFDI